MLTLTLVTVHLNTKHAHTEYISTQACTHWKYISTPSMLTLTVHLNTKHAHTDSTSQYQACSHWQYISTPSMLTLTVHLDTKHAHMDSNLNTKHAHTDSTSQHQVTMHHHHQVFWTPIVNFFEHPLSVSLNTVSICTTCINDEGLFCCLHRSQTFWRPMKCHGLSPSAQTPWKLADVTLLRSVPLEANPWKSPDGHALPCFF